MKIKILILFLVSILMTIPSGLRAETDPCGCQYDDCYWYYFAGRLYRICIGGCQIWCELYQQYMCDYSIPDSDGDGINDCTEFMLGLNHQDPDCDDDGLWDGAEYENGADPFDPDPDDDGVLDGSDVCPISKPVKNQETGQTYNDVQSAYDAAQNHNHLLVQYTINLDEEVFLNRALTVYLRGGLDCDYSSVQGATVINNLTVTDGKLVVEDGILIVGDVP